MRTGKIIKRTFLTIGIIFGLLLVTLILAPILFKDKIFAVVKSELNKQLNAEVDFKDIDISLIRNFPKLSVGIEALSIANIEPFRGDTLIAAESIRISLDLMKAIKGEYQIRNVAVIHPRIHALVNADGRANWDIMKADSTAAATEDTSAPSAFALELQKYSIEKGYIFYRDMQTGMLAEIRNLNHSGSGDFSSDQFTLRTKTKADAVSFQYGNIPYLNNVATILNIDLNIDNTISKYSFSTDAIQLNGLKLSANGSVQLPDSVNTIIDLYFKTPSNDFKDILSLIPGIYKKDFNDIKTTGRLKLEGLVKGTLNETQLPAYNLQLHVEDGSFRYPDLPQGVTDIQIDLSVNNPDGVTDHAIVDLKKAHLVFGNAPFDLRLLLKYPETSRWVDLGAKGRLDLSQIKEFVPLEEGTRLTGIVNADMAMKGSLMAAEKKQFDKIDASGNIEINNLFYADKDLPDGASVHSLLLSFNPKNVTVSNLKGSYSGANFSGNGYVNNLLAYYLNNDPLEGQINVSVDKLDLNKLMGDASDDEAVASAETTNTSSTEVFIVPDNLNLTLNATAGQVIYDNLILDDVKGAVTIKDETVFLKNLSAKALDGTMVINGTYSTKNDKRNPDISFNYQMQRLDIEKTFATFNTVEKLMPAGKYISGKMTSHFTVKGKLDQEMNPQLNSLTGEGDLLLIDGVLSKFEPIEQLAKKLNIKQLEKISVKDIKNYFRFENGRVNIDPFKFNQGNIAINAGGSHGFDQTLDYVLDLNAPRSIIGSQGNALINDLAAKAKAKGVPVELGEQIQLAVKITGTIDKPVIQTNLKESAGNLVDDLKQKVEAEVKAKADSLKKVAQDSLNALKVKAEEEARKAADDAKEKAKKAAEEELKRQLSGQKDSSNLKKDLEKAGQDAGGKAKDALKGMLKKK